MEGAAGAGAKSAPTNFMVVCLLARIYWWFRLVLAKWVGGDRDLGRREWRMGWDGASTFAVYTNSL